MARLAEEAETLAKLARILHEETAHGSWRGARSTAKECLSILSRLHSRLSAIVEVQDEAQHMAEVDRATQSIAGTVTRMQRDGSEEG